MIPRKYSLVLIVAVALVAMTAVVLGGFAWLTSRADLERQLARLHQEQAILSDQLAESLALPVWNFDRAQVARIVEGALANTDVVAVVLRFNDVGHSVFGRQRGPQQASRAIESEREIPPESLRVDRAIEGGGERLGQVSVFVTTEFVREAVRTEFLRDLWRIAVLEIILVASVYGALWRLLLRPLRILEADAQAIRQGQDISAVVAGRRFRGEIESLRASLLSTLETLQNRYDKLKEAEAALRESESKFRTLFETAHDGIFLMDEQVILFCNSRSLEMFGCVERDFVGHSPIDFSPETQPDGRTSAEKARDLIGRALQGQPQSFGWRHRRLGGTLFEAEVSLNRIEVGGRICLQAIVRDVTERKRAEELLRGSEEKFAKAFQASPMIIVLSRASDGRLIDVNEAFEKLVGYTREEALGRTAMELKLWANLADCDRLLASLRANRRLRGEEVQFVAKSGEKITCLLSAETIEVDGEKCSLAIIENITERKQLELQFLQAQKMEAIGHLAGGVAHDFNNILAALMMGLELLREKEGLDRETRISLKELEAETKRAAGLTRQLLMFSRRSVLEVRVLDMNEVVANLLKMLGRLLGEHVKLVFERHSALPVVEADAGMLEQVLMNLVVNARDAMPRGGRITLATEPVEFAAQQIAANPARRAGRFVCLAVSDTGCGMNAGTL